MKMTKLSFKRSILQVLLIALLLIMGVCWRSDSAVKKTGRYEAELRAASSDQNTPKTENEIKEAKGNREKAMREYMKQNLHTPWTRFWYKTWASLWGMSERLWEHSTIRAHIHWASWLWFSAIAFVVVALFYRRIGKKILEDDSHGQRNKATVSKLDFGVLYPQVTFVLTLILIGANAVGSVVEAPILLTGIAATLIMIIEYLVYSTNGGKLASWSEIFGNLTAPFRDWLSSVLGFLHINVEKEDDHGISKGARKRSRQTARRVEKRERIDWGKG